MTFFNTKYILFGQRLSAYSVDTRRKFNVETKVYAHIKKKASIQGWKYTKVDTYNQIGFPDNLLFKGDTYWLIEGKILKKKQLIVLEDDLKWQPLQLSFMVDSLRRKLNYALVVGYKSKLCWIQGDYLNDTINNPYTSGLI